MEHSFSWAAVELQLKPCCRLVDSKSSPANLELKGREEKGTILPRVGEGETINWPLQGVRTILYPTKRISCINHVAN